MIVLAAGDLTAAQTAAAVALDALGTGAHGAAHGILHGPAVGDTLLQLLGNVLSHQLSVHVGVADLDDVELGGLADHLLNSQAGGLDVLALLADDHAGTGAVQVDGDAAVAALDLDLGNLSVVQVLLQVVTDLLVLDQKIADLLIAGIPTGIPVLDDAHAHAVGINFLSHKLSPPLSLFRDRQGHVRSSLVDAVGAALSPGHHPLEDGAGGGEHLGHVELLNIHVEVVLSIGHGALEELHHRLRGSLGGLHEDGHSGTHILTADQIGNDLDLAGSDAEIFQISVCFHFNLHPPSLLALGVAAEGAGGGELTQLVTDHILLDVDGHMLAAVVDGDGVAHEGGVDSSRPWRSSH